MQDRRLIESLPRAPGCYAVTVPYAESQPVREEELLLEVNPYAVVSHYSALVVHGFTLERPNILTAWPGEMGWATPIGTFDDEWTDIALPNIHHPQSVLDQEVRWFSQFSDFSFGVTTEYFGPIQIRITDRERTLIDALQWPSHAGGIGNVARAWELFHGFVDIDTIVDYTERYGINLLRQRVGYLAELLGYSHPQFDEWSARSQRGGSSKLVSSRPFGPDVSSRWNISINFPVEAFLR